MRKHFLLLMLMALLPMVGFAVKPAVSTAPTAVSSLTYTGIAQNLVSAGTAEGGNTLYYAVVDDGAAAPATTAYTTTVPTGKNAGAYDVYYLTKDGDEVASDAVKIDVAIAKASLVVTPKNAGITYGDDLPAITAFYTATGWVNSETEAVAGYPVTLPAITLTAGTLPIMLTPNEMTNYTVSFSGSASCELAVAKKLIIVKTNAVAPITYGAANPAFTATITGFAYDDDESVLGGALTFVAKQGGVEKELKNAGTYQIFPTGLTSNDYNFDFQSVDFTINTKALTPSMIQAISGLEYNGTDQKTNIDALVILKDGTTTMAVTDDYTIAYKKGGSSVTVLKNAGTYTVEVTGANNYTGTVSKTFDIAKKTLYIKTKNRTETYTSTPFTASYTTDVTTVGLVGGDELATILGTNTLTTTYGDAASQTNVGTYSIKVTGSADDDDMFDNYTPSYGNIGKLIIEPATVTITAKNLNKAYGATHKLDAAEGYQTVAGDYTTYVTVTGLLGSDVLTAYPLVKREAGETFGTYAITPSAANAGDNYTINYVNGTFTIGKASVTIWAEDKTSVYGQDKVALTAIIDGMTEEDAASVQAAVNAVLSIENEGNNAGEYTIIVDEASIVKSSVWDNYNATVTTVPGKYTITRAPLKIEALPQAHHVDDLVNATASDETVKIITEGVSDEDKAALFAKITLEFSTTSPTVPVKTGGDAGKLDDGAKTSGWDGTNTTSDGIWVNGIVINHTAYDADNTMNYILTGTGASADAGKLFVTTAGEYITLPRVAKADFSNSTKNTAAATIASNNGKMMTVKLGESLDYLAEKWYSIVLPFDTDVKTVSEAFGYAVVDVFDKENSNGTDVRFKLHMQELPANEPFIVKIYQKKNNNTVEFENVIIKNSDAPEISDAYGNKFIGTYTGKNGGFNSDVDYVFGMGADKNSYDPAGSSFYVRPLGAWVNFKDAQTAGAPAHNIIIEELDGSYTSISVATREAVAKTAEGWYTVNGIKLQAAPTEKGVYIQNGKKVVIKQVHLVNV